MEQVRPNGRPAHPGFEDVQRDGKGRVAKLRDRTPPVGGASSGRRYLDLGRPRTEIVADITNALVTSGRIFRQGRGEAGRVITVATLSAEQRQSLARSGIVVPDDTPVLVKVTPESLADHIDRYADVGVEVALSRRQGGGLRWQERDFPVGLARFWLALPEWNNLPELRGVAYAPLMMPDGSIVSDPGFHARAGTWLAEGMDHYPIPEAPTREQAVEAKEILEDLLRNYSFERQIDRTAAIGALLQSVLHFSMRTAPLLVSDANMPRTGKGHLLRTICRVATGRDPVIVGMGGGRDEREKRLPNALLLGAAFLVLDNINGELSSDDLCSLIGEGSALIRPYGVVGGPKLVAYSGVIAATGNNIRMRGDLATRAMPFRQDAGIESPQDRRFDFDPWKAAIENRRTYLTAILTLARWAVRRGPGFTLPDDLKGAGIFGDWSCLVRAPLLAIDGIDVVDAIAAASTEDREASGEGVVFAALAEHFGNFPFTAVEIREALLDASKAPIPETPGQKALISIRHDLPESSRGLGRWLARHNGLIHNGFRLGRVRNTSDGAGRYLIEPWR